MSERVEALRRQLREYHTHAESVWCSDYGCGDIRDLVTEIDGLQALLNRTLDGELALREALDQADNLVLRAKAQLAAAEARERGLREALEEHACIEKPEEGFTKERYPKHSCWAALTPPGAGG